MTTDQISLITIGAILFCVLWCSCAIACRWTRNTNPLAIAFLMSAFGGVGFFILIAFAATT